MLFSATLDGEVARIAKKYTHPPVRHEHIAPKSNVQVEHRFVGVTHEKRFDALLAELRSDRELALIFVRTKRGADRLVKKLGSNGIKAVAMHGNKSQGQRERALASFDSGKVDALVATDVAARGIDVDGISHVINFDPPGDCDAYQHRIGRTARAGRGGVGVTLVRHEEAKDVGKIAHALRPARELRARRVRAPGPLRPPPGAAQPRWTAPPAAVDSIGVSPPHTGKGTGDVDPTGARRRAPTGEARPDRGAEEGGLAGRAQADPGRAQENQPRPPREKRPPRSY